MIPVSHRQGQSLYVFGLGKTGITAIKALVAGGASVAAWDDKDTSLEAARVAGASLVPPDVVDWGGIAALVLSPGVPLTHPQPHGVVQLAHRHNVPILGDVELFLRELENGPAGTKIVAVTGTNGKSTTTALIGHILRSAGRDVQIGGNIGSQAVLELKPSVNQTCYVIEVSSYQIDLTPGLKPDVAVFLNLSPDHLDRHGGFSNYGAVKAKIFASQGKGDMVVLGTDDAATIAMAGLVPQGVETVLVSSNHEVSGGVYCLGTCLYDAISGRSKIVVNLDGLGGLRGEHNRQNAAAATAVCLSLGLGHEEIAESLRSFGGLEHRLEEIGSVGPVLLINDSKATNADSAERALRSFRNIFWIAGGRAKSGGIETLRPEFDRIEKAFLIGEAAAEFAETLDGHVAHEICGTLDVAFDRAAKAAAASKAPEPVVLLAPACASFDQYPSFEHRGEDFRRLAKALIATQTQGKNAP